jgi:GT2 family glycosyltransferase
VIYIVIPAFNRIAFTLECLESLNKQTYRQFVVVVVDHGSTDNTSQLIEANYPDTIILQGDSSMWWTAATNLGVSYALDNKADYVLTLNNDLIVEDSYLQVLIDAATTNPGCIIGSISADISSPEKIVYAGTKWNNLTAKYSQPVKLNLPYSTLKANHQYIQTDLLPGRGTLIPIDVFKKVGLYDEYRFPHYMADEDLSRRAVNIGYKLLIASRAIVYSHVAATGLANVHKKKSLKYWRDFFISIRSANNFQVRKNWAFKHGRFKILYLALDYGRIIVSQIIKLAK